MIIACVGTKIIIPVDDSLDVEFTVYDNANSLFSLVGFNAYFKVLGTSLLKDSTVPGAVTISIATSKITFHLKPADTVGFNQEIDYNYKARIYTMADKYTFGDGIFKVT